VPVGASASDADNNPITVAEQKYRELYVYSTTLLKEELERFNRADEKAAKIGATFVFLIGGAAYFDKAISDKLIPPHSRLEWALVILGGLTLAVSFVGWFLANWVPRMRGYSRLPLNKEVFDFFDEQPLLNFYGSFSKNAQEAFEANERRTNRKHAVLVKAFYAMVLATILLVSLVSLYGLYSWQNPGKFDSMKEPVAPEPKKREPVQAEVPAAKPPNVPTAAPPKPDWEVKAPDLSVSLHWEPSDKSENLNDPPAKK
jgi:hypothetical protein